MSAQEILKVVLNELPDGVVIRDEGGQVIAANELGERLLASKAFDEEPFEFEGRFFRFSRKPLAWGEMLFWRDVTESEKLRDLMVIDPETGVYNARYMREELERELDRVHRTGSQMALVLVDVDPGEEGPSMAEIASTLRRTVRNYDKVCTGDRSDFVLMLFAVDPDKVEAMGERILRALKDIGVARVSLGISLSARAPSAEALMKLAQRALYVVNAKGGNDFSIY